MPFRKKYSLLNLHMLGLLQGRAYRDLHNHLSDGLSSFHLSLTQWKALALINDGFDTTTQVAQILDVESPLATRLIKQLIEKGYVRKKENATDRRISTLSPTPKAKIAIPLINMAVGKLLYDLMGGLSKSDIKTYVRVLETIVTNAKKYETTDTPPIESFQHYIYATNKKGGENI